MGSTTEFYQNELVSRGWGSPESRERNAAWRRDRDQRNRDRARRDLTNILAAGGERKSVQWSSAYFVSPGVMYSPTYDEYVTVDGSRACPDQMNGVQ